ncbi:NAD(P)H-dependent oxidoreductase subunit E [Ruminococcaceae bacterium OttesenSCG-928-I18]|nr:NAD(P)H-dependent oxidoreductase subunit E [Ruminococcaceae bacterium OttesenSCG-928-I18]
MTKEKVREIIEKNGGRAENILAMLLDCQYASYEGYVDAETAAHIAHELGLSETRVFELLTYYAMLQTKPQAKYVLMVCNSSPCHFTKANEVTQVLEKQLGVKLGETTADGLFVYHYTACVGACDIGPVIKVNDKVFGNLDEGAIVGLLNGLRDGTIEV